MVEPPEDFPGRRTLNSYSSPTSWVRRPVSMTQLPPEVLSVPRRMADVFAEGAEQAFSYDDRTWETNWTADFTAGRPQESV